MNEDIIHGAELIKLYKQNKITEYCLCQELGHLLGEYDEVKIHNANATTTTDSFGIFVVPEQKVNGVKLTYFIDKGALFNLYTPEELLERIVLIASVRQNIVSEFLKFVLGRKESVISLGAALACLLRIYQGTLSYLKVDGKDFLPTDTAVGRIVNELEAGKNVDANIENLGIANILPKEAVDSAKLMVHDYPDEILTTIKFSAEEKPSQNIFATARRKYCDGTYADLGHMDIPDNYKPSTNQ